MFKCERSGGFCKWQTVVQRGKFILESCEDFRSLADELARLLINRDAHKKKKHEEKNQSSEYKKRVRMRLAKSLVFKSFKKFCNYKETYKRYNDVKRDKFCL